MNRINAQQNYCDTDGSGALTARLAYDAWGRRRNLDGSAIDCTAGTAPPSGVTRGFTGAEMLDGLCLINLNARLYDPGVGRFMAADPVVGRAPGLARAAGRFDRARGGSHRPAHFNQGRFTP